MIQWHVDEITELPMGAVLLAASTHYPVQAFRIGPVAWGTQFHIECDTEMFADWAIGEVGLLADLGLDRGRAGRRGRRGARDVAEAWKPFAERFAAVALGTLPIAEEGTRFAAAARLMSAARHDRRRALPVAWPATGSPTPTGRAVLVGPVSLALWDETAPEAGRRGARRDPRNALLRR